MKRLFNKTRNYQYNVRVPEYEEIKPQHIEAAGLWFFVGAALTFLFFGLYMQNHI